MNAVGSIPGASGMRDSVYHHLLEATSETATVPELRQRILHTPPPLGGGGGDDNKNDI